MRVFFLTIWGWGLLLTPTPARAAPDDDHLSKAASVDFVELHVGDVIEGWQLVALSASTYLFDGRPTREPCGYTRRVTVERPHPEAGQKGLSPTARERREGEIAVTCKRQGGQLVAATIELLIEDNSVPIEPAPPSPKPAEATTAEAPATQPGISDPAPLTASDSTRHAAPVPSAPFAPADPAVVTRMPSPIDAQTRFPAPAVGAAGQVVEGVVELEVEVTRDGLTRQVRVRKSLHPTLDKMSIAAAQDLRWQPALAGEQPVDVVTTLPIEWVRPEPTLAEARLGKATFRKGELSNLGSVQLINARSSAGVALGAAQIDGVLYAVLRPDLNLHLGPFAMGLGAPLRFELFDSKAVDLVDPASYADGVARAGRFRTEDWDHAFAYPYTDLLLPIRYLSWGRKEDHLYVDVNRVRALTIGHGQIMRRYAPNIDIEDSNLFAELDAYGDIGGVELIAGPLPIPRLFGGLAFVKPLGLFMDGTLPKSWSIGLSYLQELNTPTTLLRQTDPDSGRVRLAVDNNALLYDGRDAIIGRSGVQAMGLDSELKVYKDESVDLKVYVDYSMLLMPGVPDLHVTPYSAGGGTLGALLRTSFGQRPVRELDAESEAVRLGIEPREMQAAHAARLRLEVKAFDPRYLPSYFNTLYEADRLQFTTLDLAAKARATLPTKAAYLAAQQGEPWRLGGYFEATYTWIDRLALSLVYEDALSTGDFSGVAAARDLILHAETQGLGFLQLFATYHYRNFDLQDFGKVLQFSTDHEVLYLGGRLQILILAFNLGVQRGFRLNFADDDAGLRSLPDGRRLPFTSTGLANQWNFMFDVEIGWQF